MAARLDELLKAAGEATRLRILNLLGQGSICVCDLQIILQIPQPTVSRHLAALRHVGLVEYRREGTRVVYSLAAASTPAMAALQELLARCSSHEDILQADLKQLRRQP